MYIDRDITDTVMRAHRYFPVALVTGPRQSGKSTLCRHLFPDYYFVNLEDPNMRQLARTSYMDLMELIGHRAIIDEVQNVPELMSAIQVAVDEEPDRRYVLTGSCNFSLMKTISQSMAGRVSIHTLLPMSMRELPSTVLHKDTSHLMFRGFYPALMADDTRTPMEYYSSYFQTYVERDVRNLFNIREVDKFDIFIRLLAGRVSSEFNASSLGVEIGVSASTISEWLAILKTCYIAFELRPYYANIGKRLTKKPKIYFCDTGLMCYLLGIREARQLDLHPLRGAIFENMVVSEMYKQKYNSGENPSLTFYREKTGREIDVVDGFIANLKLYEIKASKTYHTDFIKNMELLASRFDSVSSTTVIYDGESLRNKYVNIRDLRL